MQYPPVRGAGRATDETERREANGHGGMGTEGGTPSLSTQRSPNAASPVRAGRMQKPQELFERDIIRCRFSCESQWILTFFPSAAQPAEPRCQRRLPQGLTGSCSTASARAPRCESLLWLRSFRSTLSFPFLWEHKRISGGKFWKDVNTVG